jgi:hypothetical protein
LSAAPQSYPICLEYLLDLATGTILRKIPDGFSNIKYYANFIHLSKKKCLRLEGNFWMEKLLPPCLTHG